MIKFVQPFLFCFFFNSSATVNMQNSIWHRSEWDSGCIVQAEQKDKFKPTEK